MLKKLKKNIKKVDLFGRPAEINFGENKKTHKTLLGGFVSIWVLWILIGLLIYKGNTMFMK